ncbi:MAG TPA: GDSL-type esterase/lipase family protein [Terracidiphilus sp.]|nr:GDSL-type esterase/lipase family protein [Terracidiphilus sp.]
MKSILNFAAILSFSVAAFGQVAAPPQSASPALSAQAPAMSPASGAVPPPMPPGPKLAEPLPVTTVPDLTRYLNNPVMLLFCTTQVAEFNDRDADMIFIGDSITRNWLGPGKAVWDANFAPRNALDFGIGGDQTQHVLWRMNNYPIGRLHPKVAVVLIGTNNYHNSPEEIAAGVKAILDKTQAMFPGIKIILNSIMPNRRANDLMMATNAILRTYADDKNIFYLDLVPLMPPVGDNWKGLSADHLHPDASGYQLWTDALLPLVNRFVPAPATGEQR